MNQEDIVITRISGLASLLEELRCALVEHIKQGWQPGGEDPAWTFNVGFLLGGCAGIDMRDAPMALFSRVHRIHAALVEIRAPGNVYEIMKRIYIAALDAQIAVVAVEAAD